MNLTNNNSADLHGDDLDLTFIDDDKLEKIYFQLRRSIRYIDQDFEKYKCESGSLSEKDNTIIHQLEEEQSQFLHGDARPWPKVCLDKKKEDEENLRKLCTKDKKAALEEARLQKELEKLLAEKRELRESTHKRKKRLGSLVWATERLQQIEKRNRRIENRIERATARLGEELVKTSQLRDAIFDIKIHYKSFNKVHNGLSQQLDRLKGDIKYEIERAKHHMRIEKETGQRLHALVSRHERDKQQYLFDLREMQMLLLHNDKARDFFLKKLDTRQAEYLHELTSNRYYEESTFMATEDKTLAKYCTAITNIQNMTKEDEIEVICNNYSQKEKDVLIQTGYVNDLNLCLREMEQELNKVRAGINDLKDQQMIRSTTGQVGLRFYDGAVGQIAVSVEDMMEKTQLYKKKVEEVKVEIDEILKLLHCVPFEHKLIKPKINYSGIKEFLSQLTDQCTASFLDFENIKLKQRLEDEKEAPTLAMVMARVGMTIGPTFKIKLKSPKMARYIKEMSTGGAANINEEEVLQPEVIHELAEEKVAGHDLESLNDDDLISIASSSDIPGRPSQKKVKKN